MSDDVKEKEQPMEASSNVAGVKRSHVTINNLTSPAPSAHSSPTNKRSCLSMRLTSEDTPSDLLALQARLQIVESTQVSLSSLTQMQTEAKNSIGELQNLLTEAQKLTPLVKTLTEDINVKVKPRISKVEQMILEEIKPTLSKVKETQDQQVKEIKKIVKTPNSKAHWCEQIDTVRDDIADLKSQLDKHSDVQPTITEIQQQIQQLKATPSSNSPSDPLGENLPETRLSVLEAELEILKADVKMQDFTNRTLCAWADNMFNEISHVKETVIHNSIKQMQNQLVFGGIKRSQRKENTKAAVSQFLQDVMNITAMDQDILFAYRKGVATVKVINGQEIRCPQQMVVKVAPRLRDTIMQKASDLKGKEDPEHHFKYFVFPQVPEGVRAAKSKYRETLKKIEKADENLPAFKKRHARVIGTKLYINNRQQPDLVRAPSPSEVIQAIALFGPVIKNIPLISTSIQEGMANKFTGYLLCASVLETVEQAYIKVRAIHPHAKHIMLGYCVADTMGSVDDGEFFGDLAILDMLRKRKATNLAIYIVRAPSNVQLGPRRFEVIRDVCTKLFQEMDSASSVITPCDRATYLRPGNSTYISYSHKDYSRYSEDIEIPTSNNTSQPINWASEMETQSVVKNWEDEVVDGTTDDHSYVKATM